MVAAVVVEAVAAAVAVVARILQRCDHLWLVKEAEIKYQVMFILSKRRKFYWEFDRVYRVS